VSSLGEIAPRLQALTALQREQRGKNISRSRRFTSKRFSFLRDRRCQSIAAAQRASWVTDVK